MIYSTELWRAGASMDNPDLTQITKVAATVAAGSLVMLDVENWPLYGSAETFRSNMDKMKAEVSAFKHANPQAYVGYFGVFPTFQFFNAIGERGPSAYQQWLLDNAKLQELASLVDVVYPCAYAYPTYVGKKFSKWEKHTKAQISEARKFGKPVYVLLWPQYMGTDPKVYYTDGAYVATELWRLQLDVCKKYADGVVIWGGHDQVWDETAPWWVETKKFMKGL